MKNIESNNRQIVVDDIIKITNGRLIVGDKNTICQNYAKDSREVQQGDIYLGFLGENSNGSLYYEQAFAKGAIGAIVQDINIDEEQKEKYKDKFIILVEDTVKAVQEIAKYKRNLYNIPVIAITGSVGKTSTKDIVASVVSKKFNTAKTEGNYNNHIGVPLTILKLKNEDALVIEMGMNHLGEIEVLTNIAKPTVAIITNIGTAHIGNLGSRENILKAKLEILTGLQEDGIVVINNDNDLLHQWYLENKNKYKIVTYGIDNKSDVMAKDIVMTEEGSTYKLVKTNDTIEVPVGGQHFVQNSLCALAIGSIYNIPMNELQEAIKTFELTKRRMDISKINGITIINDCYNANYDSMKAAIEYLGNISDKRKIAVLGDMLELGDFSKKLHEDVGHEIVKNNIDIVITVGDEARNIAKIANNKIDTVIECISNKEAVEVINKIKKENDCILFKASNGMHFEEIIKEIK